MSRQLPHPGHLFVIHGSIEALVHDAVILPVGDHFGFHEAWRPLIGDRPVRPRDWATRKWGRVTGSDERVWAVSVGGRMADPYDEILDRVEAAISRVDERRDAHSPKRGQGTLPLVLLPVIGIGRGGYGSARGDVLRALVARLHTAAERYGVDVGLVAPDRSVYAAAQYARRAVSAPLPERFEKLARELGEQAARGELALLLGAGVGVPAGLPTWHQLISGLAREFGLDDADLTKHDLTATDQAELIERHRETEDFQRRVAERIKPHRQASLLHGLLASLDCREVVTTNYDTLYEQAVRATGREIESVMPWGSAHGSQRWVLKLHGDVEHPNKIVLTRRHMVRYDAANRPSGALLQSLLLTRHLLAVGVSMTDDNVIRLAHEVQEYRELHLEKEGKPVQTEPFGVVLDASGDDVRSRLWSGQLDWVRLPDMGPGNGYRAVELLLDRVAQHAAKDSSWVLNEAFAGLLPEDERELAAAVRRLSAQLPQRPGTKWWPLVERLREMGAPGDGD